MTLSEGQVQLRDLVIGPGTSYRMPEHFNPFARSVRADESGPRAWRAGSWSGAEFTGEAVVPMRIVTLGEGTTGMVALHQPLAAAFAPSSTDLDLTFTIGGVEYLMRGRPRLVEPAPRRISGTCYYQAAFVALDPLIYSAALHTEVLGLPQATGGLTVPVTAPVTITATDTSGHVAIGNTGTAPTALTLRIDGPVSQPRVALVVGSTSTVLRFALDLTSGQWLDVDCAARTVYLNGTVSRRGQAYGGWPVLPNGVGDVSFAAAAFEAAAQLTVSWRDAWH